MAGKLEFKISAVDETKKAFESASSRADKMLDQYKELSKAGLGPSGEIKGLKKMENQFKRISKEISNMGKQSKQAFQQQPAGRSGSSSAESGVATAGGMLTSDADITMASKVRDIGKGMQVQKTAAQDVAKELKTGGKAFSREKKKKKNDMNRIKAGAKSLSGGVGGGMGMGIGGSMGVGGGLDVASAAAKQAQEVGKATVIPGAGATLAVAGTTYLMAAKMASAYRQTAGQQMQGMQILGRAGGGQPGGFYAGHEGLGITGAQRVGIMTTYAKQTGITGPDADSGYDQRMKRMASISAAYGISTGQVSGYGGSFDRYIRGEDKKGSGLTHAILTAEKKGVGMGGARLPEFMDSVKNSLEDAVASGSTVSNKELIDALGMMTSSSDERLKKLAPSIIQGASGSFRQAGMLKGGASESFAMQAVYSQMKKADPSATMWDVRERLSKGATVGNLKANIDFARKMSGGDERMAATMLQQTSAFSGVSSGNQMLEVMKTIDSYKKSEGGGKASADSKLGKLLGGRLEGTKEQRSLTLTKAVQDEQLNLNEANKDATIAVNGLKTAIVEVVEQMNNVTKGKSTFEKISMVSNPLGYYLSQKAINVVEMISK